MSDRPAGLTLSNWDLGGPVSQWSYRHADELFYTETLEPALTVGAEDDHPDLKTPPGIEADLESGQLSAVTIMAGGRTAFRWQDGPDGRHLLMSVSKIITSLAVGILADQGALGYADPVRRHLPELGDQWEGCLLQHVLDMTSGVDCPEVGDAGAYSDPEHPFFQFEASLGWRPRVGITTSPYDLVLGYDRSGEPGTRYAYTSVNTFLLAWIIERITGLRYPQAVQRLIWDQLALAEPSAICVNDTGVSVAYGGLIMAADDLARLGTLFTRPVHHRLRVPDSYLRMLQAPRDFQPTYGTWPPGAHPAGQWNLIFPDGDMFKSGFGGQGLYVSPANDVVIAFCGVPDSRARTHQLAANCRDLAKAFGVPLPSTNQED